MILAIKSLAQKHIDYFDNGSKRYQAYYDKNGILVKNKRWDKHNRLISKNNFKSLQKKVRLSKIKWIYNNKIGIHFENKGSGSLPSEGDTLVLHYIGYFDDGEQFDNSFERDSPLEFELGNNYMLVSFSNSVSKFKEGQKGFIKIPSELGYGDKPTGNIPPNSTLIYFVEILKIKD